MTVRTGGGPTEEKEADSVRKILAKVDDARLGRAIAGLVRHELVVQNVRRDGGEVRAEVVSRGKRGKQVYGVAFHVVGRGHIAFCSCADRRERGVNCKHIAVLALHELGMAAQARSEHRELSGVLLQL